MVADRFVAYLADALQLIAKGSALGVFVARGVVERVDAGEHTGGDASPAKWRFSLVEVDEDDQRFVLMPRSLSVRINFQATQNAEHTVVTSAARRQSGGPPI